MCATGLEEQVVSWERCFPFVGDFRQVVDGEITLEYVSQLACVLEPAVGVFTQSVEEEELNEFTVRSLFYTAAALARCRVVQAYQSEIENARTDKDSLLEALCYEWDKLVDREALVTVEYSPLVGKILDESVRSVWIPFTLQRVYTASDVCARYPAFITDVCVVALNQVLVVSERGSPLSSVLLEHGDKPVLPADVYRLLLNRVKKGEFSVADVGDPLALLQSCSGSMDVGVGQLDSTVVATWLWLILASFGGMHGFCYQLLYPPAQRYMACTLLLQRPRVSELLWHLESVETCWSRRLAVIHDGDDLHVSDSGNADLEFLRGRVHCRIGMMRGTMRPEVDYYARALVDEFIEKHKPVSSASDVPPPLDAEFEMLSVSADSAAGREFVDVAKLLYSAVDETISPRAEVGDTPFSGFPTGDDGVNERDSAIVQEVYNRLSDGAVIHESYFIKTYRSFRKLRRRPKLDNSDGRLYHVFEGFPADGGVGTGPWLLDKNWGIPGWQSYIAEFDAGEVRTVSFSVDGGCQDVRMDCSGEGAIELGDCKVRVDGTLLWFTNSIRLKVVAKDDVCLRISVPDALGAVAMGSEMRRYMHIPGYTVVARSYDVVTGSVSVNVPMERVKRNSVAGCHVYSGQRYIERGRHRFKLSQVASLAPARVLFKTDPPEALQHVSVCGMRLHPRTRDHVSALVDLRNVEMYVTVATGATLLVSMVQIVRIKEYELTVVSTMDARKARGYT